MVDKRSNPIENDTVRQLLRRARTLVEDMVWKDGRVFYPGQMHRRVTPQMIAENLFPREGGPAEKACVIAIRRHTGKDLSPTEARHWFTDAIDRRFGDFVRGAREKIGAVEMVVTESSVEVKAVRPDTTETTVGPAPWSSQL